MANTVVIVDDSKFIVKILTKFFEETLQFIVVGTGTNGIEAIELYRKFKPDLLSLDVVMPNKDGLEVIEKVIGEFPDAKILIVSAIRGESLVDCMQAGVADYISKPMNFNNPEFVKKFENIVNKILLQTRSKTENLRFFDQNKRS
jgi:two-component system chemotaxis response regulator CheY